MSQDVVVSYLGFLRDGVNCSIGEPGVLYRSYSVWFGFRVLTVPTETSSELQRPISKPVYW